MGTWRVGFAMFAFFAGGAFASQDASGPTVEYERFVETVFPQFKLERRFIKPLPSQQATYQSILSETVSLLEVTGQIWIQALTAGGQNSESSIGSSVAPDLESLLALMKRMPLWVCDEECKGFGTSVTQNREAISFLRAKRVGDLLAAVVVIKACAFEAQGCLKAKPARRRKGPAPLGDAAHLNSREALVLGLQTNLAELAYVHLYGELTATKEFNARIHDAFLASQKAFAQIKAIRNRCLTQPKEGFESKTITYLEQQGHLSRVDSAWNNCGKGYLTAVQKLPARCLAHWGTSAELKMLSRAKIFKVDGPGHFMLCGRTYAPPETPQELPLLRRFEDQWIVALTRGSCDGSTPQWLGSFVKATTQKAEGCVVKGDDVPVVIPESSGGIDVPLLDF